MSPRDLRAGLQGGIWTATAKSPPAPPPEWKAFRRKRMAIAVRAAWDFLYRGKSYDEIAQDLKAKKHISRIPTRARIGQYVTRGTEFLIDRGVFVEAHPKS